MLALFTNPLARDAMLGLLLLAVLASGYGYYRWSVAEIAALRGTLATTQVQAADFAAARAKQDHDIAAIKAAQDQADRSITRVRDAAAQAARAIRATPPPKVVDSRSLQTRLNADQAATLQALEALSQ